MGKEVVSPLVSIICNTYNHVNYIRQCLDGFLMQETNFPIEILVHDDASTDGTADIVREYEDKYPDLIKPIYQTENQYSKGVKVSLKYQYSRAQGKYIALCEGDDYWTDPLKLQKQVDLLENNQDCVMCSSSYKIYNQLTNQYSNPRLNYGLGEYTLDNLILGDWLFHPLTVIFKRSVLDICDLTKYKRIVDLILFYELLNHGGKGLFLSDVTAVYRLHDSGIWSRIHYAAKRQFEFDVRFDVYEVNKSLEAAVLLTSQLQKPLSRKWLLTNLGILVKLFGILLRHLGCLPTLSIICSKVFFSKTPDRKKIETLLAQIGSKSK